MSSETQGDLLLSALAEARPWQPRSGMQLGSYALEAELGTGAFAAVWRAQHVVLGSEHALKIIMANTSSRIRARVVREAKIQATIQHMNVASVQDVFSTDEGRLVLVMELIEGPSLAQWLRGCRPRPVEAEAVFRGILAGVRAAHDRGIIHRDVKPGNILLEVGAVVRVVDFGLVLLLRDDQQQSEEAGHLVGTPRYMRPEQIRSAASAAVPLRCSRPAGPRSTQAAQGRQDPADAEAAVVRWHPCSAL